MAHYNQEIVKVRVPVSTNMPIKMLPASPTIHKCLTKHEIFDNTLTYIQSQIDLLKE